MIQELIKNVLSHKGVQLLQKMDLNAERQNEILELTSDSILDELRESIQSGNSKDILQAFTGGTSSHLVQRTIKRCSLDLLFNLGLGAGMADTISNALVPMVFSTLSNDKNISADAGNSFELIMKELKAAPSEDQLGDMLGGMFGLR